MHPSHDTNTNTPSTPASLSIRKSLNRTPPYNAVCRFIMRPFPPFIFLPCLPCLPVHSLAREIHAFHCRTSTLLHIARLLSIFVVHERNPNKPRPRTRVTVHQDSTHPQQPHQPPPSPNLAGLGSRLPAPFIAGASSSLEPTIAPGCA